EERSVSNPTIEDAIKYAADKGCIVVFSAGNDTDDVQFYYTARHPQVISVASVNINDRRAGDSNFGSLVTVAAPGVKILSLKLGTDGYRFKSGTSMACPHVAGLVALLLAKRPNLTFSEIKQILQDNGDVIETDRPIGRRINAARSLSAIAAPPAPQDGIVEAANGIREKFAERIARPERETV
ncbi:MAG TPA: S8 family serine peptidase, partial [Pyrinomonadaceae bacterium]